LPFVSYTSRHVSFWLVLGLLCTVALPVPRADAQAPTTLGRANTWSARSNSGLTLAGTWTATEDPKTGAVTGTWTLLDAQGRVTANGGWSAVKSPSGWNGSWRAVAAGRSGEYAGTWAAKLDVQSSAKMSELFTQAVAAAVSGTWQAGRESGSWTIQAFR
jgi:hypothetical protein